MTSIIIQVSKYLILFMFLGYVLGAFYVFRYGKQPDKQKVIYVIQKVLLFTIHAFGFLCLYLQNNNMELIGFYLMQVLLLGLIFMFYHFMYKCCSVLLINNMCMLLVIGMIVITRISFDKAFKQFLFIAVGSILMLVIPLFLQKGSIFRKFSAIYFVIGVSLLAVVVAIGATSYGAKLTISIGSFSFQPSEFVKILFIFFVASMLYKKTNFKQVLLTSGLSAIYVLLLVASKDLGGALLYFVSYLMILYVATRKMRYLGAGMGGMAIAAVLGYCIFPHVRTRVFVWLNPTADIDNKGYQICQSLFGIGTGGWFGFGIGEGLPTKIPVVDKDFIFSAISEEFGAIFAIGLILLCFSCFIMIVNVSMQMKDRFYKLVGIGLASLYAMQVILTIGGAIKFIPSTGVTLPLVSYGGSSMLSTFIIFGIVQGLYMRKAVSQSNIDKKKVAVHKEDKKNRNFEYRVVTYFFAIIFTAMLGYFVFFLTFQSEEFINNEYNGLQTLLEKEVKKGEIITSDGYVIAETVTDKEGNTKRKYPYGKMFAHVTGYSSNIRTGLEKQMNFTLLRSNAFFMEKFIYDLSNEKQQGDHVVTTIRYDLQEAAYKALGKHQGAVVAIEPSTGKILAMVSNPSYDPNSIEKDWDELQSGSALYNRATQGQYAPGSIFKMITLLAYIESNKDTFDNYSYQCTGKITIQNKTIRCASGKSHGKVDLKTSFAKSCNTSFANMMQGIDPDVFQEMCNSMLFNQSLPISFESSKSSFFISEEDEISLKLDTAIGQGKTLVSPLHMAMITSAIFNDGMLMRPYLVERIENYKGILVEETKQKEYQLIFNDTQTAVLKEFMRETITNGTATKLHKDDYTAYGKTGTAQTTNDLNKTNAWFVGSAEKDGREIVIAVVVEDSGSGSKYAVPIAEKIFDLYFK